MNYYNFTKSKNFYYDEHEFLEFCSWFNLGYNCWRDYQHDNLMLPWLSNIVFKEYCIRTNV